MYAAAARVLRLHLALSAVGDVRAARSRGPERVGAVHVGRSAARSVNQAVGDDQTPGIEIRRGADFHLAPPAPARESGLRGTRQVGRAAVRLEGCHQLARTRNIDSALRRLQRHIDLRGARHVDQEFIGLQRRFADDLRGTRGIQGADLPVGRHPHRPSACRPP